MCHHLNWQQMKEMHAKLATSCPVLSLISIIKDASTSIGFTTLHLQIFNCYQMNRVVRAY